MAGFSIGRGTNMSHWLSQSKARGAERRARLTWEDVARCRDWGLDHLRLPIDEEQMWTAEEQRETEAFDLLGEALDHCQRAGLKAIVDLHILRSHYFLDKNPPLFTEVKEAEKFARLWGDLSVFLRERSVDQVAYELMNEAVAIDDEDWNRAYEYPYRALRKLEPERTIVLGSNRWNQCRTFGNLRVPQGDPHMILTFHFYHPLLITHYTASWAENVREYSGPIAYPGKPITDESWTKVPEDLKARLATENRFYDADEMEKDMALPLEVARRTGLPLYCGEFGVYHAAPDDIRLRWYRDFVGVLEKHHIAWGNWDYRGGFGLIDAQGRETAVFKGLLG